MGNINSKNNMDHQGFDKKMLITAGKWAAIIILTGINFFFYNLNKSQLNLILTFAILGYSLYEFFSLLSGRKLHLGIKLYLLTFYLFAVITLFAGIQSLIRDNFRTSFICLALIIGDILLIRYSINKLSRT